MNLRLLSVLSLFLTGITLPAQFSSYDQAIHHEYFDLIEYDSIGLSLDTAGAFTTLTGLSQEYFFQNNSKVRSFRLFAQGSLQWEGFGEWKGRSSVLKTYELSSQDTFQKETFYLDVYGRDSVHEMIGNYNQPNEDISQVHYTYNAFGRVAHKIELEGVPLDTTYREKYFYGGSGELDSILISEASGQVVLRVYFIRDGADRVSSVFMVGKLPNNSVDTLSSYEPIYNSSSKVYEIRTYNHAFVPSKELSYMLRFYKKPNSTIGLGEAWESGFELFPNPATSQLNITLPFQPLANVQVAIYSLGGNVVRSKTFETTGKLNFGLDLSIPAGTYVVKVKTAGTEFCKKVVVTK